MNHKRSFDKNYLNQEFDKLNAKTKQSITLFLIGGGAMAFYGLKEATKDVDIILTKTHRPHRYLLKTQTQKHATEKQKATTKKTKRTKNPTTQN
jgi:hypothetical protein